jgi:hypothetical protein
MGSTSRGIGSAKPRQGQRDSVKFDEVIGMYEFNKHPNEHIRVRLLEKGLIAVKRHWCKIVAGNTKKEVQVPRFCLKFNPMDENTPHDVDCPYCALVTKDRETSQVTNEFFYLTNAIIREIQEEEPSKKAEHTKEERKTKFKDIRSKSWTPVRVLRLTSSMVGRMQELGDQNTKTDKETGKSKRYDVSHPKFGIDLNIKYKPKAAGTDKYSIDAVGKRTPITKEEDAYLVWNLTEELLDVCGRMTAKQAKEDFQRMEFVGGEALADDDEDDDDTIPVGKKGKKGRAAFDEDDDEPVKKKKKSKLSDDDDDEPVKKKKKKKPVDDDEDDEPVKKKKKADKSKDKKVKAGKKKSKPSDDDDDDDDDDEPVKKKKSKDKKSKVKDKPKKKKAAKSKIDDDDDWD